MSRLGQHDVGHEGVITERDGFSLRSLIANPQGVAQFPLQSTYLHSSRFKKTYPQHLVIHPVLSITCKSLNNFSFPLFHATVILPISIKEF
ncbi:hypothetical protein LSPCS325_49610 [Lysinibacillus sp. CTST325]